MIPKRTAVDWVPVLIIQTLEGGTCFVLEGPKGLLHGVPALVAVWETDCSEELVIDPCVYVTMPSVR